MRWSAQTVADFNDAFATVYRDEHVSAVWCTCTPPDRGEILALGHGAATSGMLQEARDYLARYGVDMTDTAIRVPGWIITDHVRRTVEFIEERTDTAGRISWGLRTVQLEAAPMPLPLPRAQSDPERTA